MITPEVETSRLIPPVSSRDHILGPATAKVTLVEYGDYECPHCGVASRIIKSVHRQLGGRVRFVFRHFPLRTAHPHAELAAEAAEVAGAQGRFWEMHDVLFEHQDALEPEDIVRYAEDIGLDTNHFVSELAARTHEPRVREDFVSGVRSGVNGTPTFFMNGLRYDGPWDEPNLVLALRRV